MIGNSRMRTNGGIVVEYLPLRQIRNRKKEIQKAFCGLLENRLFARKPNSAQWRFFSVCFGITVMGNIAENVLYSKLQSAQYKYEVQCLLDEFYKKEGTAVDYVFSLFNERQIKRLQFELEKNYPSSNGYYLLIRDRRVDPNVYAPVLSDDIACVEKTVARCLQVEFEAYQRLPTIERDSLLECYLNDEPAYKEIIARLEGLKRRGWIITNFQNPSTYRLTSIKVKKIDDKCATVKTTEYWYLFWWSESEKRYRYPYRETNHQTYYLTKVDGNWFVEVNERPSPRTSTPLRRKKSK
jgi:hypothetical protein